MGHVDDRVGDTAPVHAPPEALFSLVVDLTDDAVIFCDPSSNVTFFSDSAERLFGRRSAEIVRHIGAHTFSGSLGRRDGSAVRGRVGRRTHPALRF